MELTGLPAGVWLAIALVTLCSATGAALSRGRARTTTALTVAWLGAVALEAFAGERFLALLQVGVLVVGIGTFELAGLPPAPLAWSVLLWQAHWAGWAGSDARVRSTVAHSTRGDEQSSSKR